MFANPTIKRAAFGTMAMAIGAAPALAALTFDAPVSYPVLQRPSGVAAADFNGDGFIDLAITADTPDRIVTLLGSATGAFSAGPVTLLPSGSGAGSIVAARFDAGPTIDVAVALQNTGAVIVLSGTGTGAFTPLGTFATGQNPRGLALGDINGDTFMDLAVANRDSNTASILIGNGAGGFAVTTLPVGNEPRGAALGDFDGDGDLDLAVTNHDDRSVSIFRWNAGAMSASGTLIVGANIRPEGIVSARLNADGLWDLAIAANGNGLELVVEFISTGAGFTGPTSYATGGVDTSEIIAADLDCDGVTDIVTGNNTSGNVSLLRNTGGGVLAAALLVATGATPEGIAAAQLNGSGGVDLAVANRDSNSVAVLMNRSCPALPGDADGDCDVDQDDIDIVLFNFGQSVPAGTRGDLDGNGVVNQDDIDIVLFRYGTRC